MYLSDIGSQFFFFFFLLNGSKRRLLLATISHSLKIEFHSHKNLFFGTQHAIALSSLSLFTSYKYSFTFQMTWAIGSVFIFRFSCSHFPFLKRFWLDWGEMFIVRDNRGLPVHFLPCSMELWTVDYWEEKWFCYWNRTHLNKYALMVWPSGSWIEVGIRNIDYTHHFLGANSSTLLPLGYNVVIKL